MALCGTGGAAGETGLAIVQVYTDEGEDKKVDKKEEKKVDNKVYKAKDKD